MIDFLAIHRKRVEHATGRRQALPMLRQRLERLIAACAAYGDTLVMPQPGQRGATADRQHENDILALLQSWKHEPLAALSIAHMLNIGRDTARDALHRLAVLGLVASTGRTKSGARRWSLVRQEVSA